MTDKEISNLNIDIQEIIDTTVQIKDYSKILELESEANKLREETKNKLKEGFNSEIFYVPVLKKHPRWKPTLSYVFAHGIEKKLANTGLWESDYRKIFQHPDFEKVINYIYPEMIGQQPWNFSR